MSQESDVVLTLDHVLEDVQGLGVELER